MLSCLRCLECLSWALREAGVSQRDGGPFEGHPCTPRYCCDVRGISGAFMMARGGNLSVCFAPNPCSDSSLENTTKRQKRQKRSYVQLSERQASLCMMGDRLRAPWNPSDNHSTIVLRGSRAAFIWPSIMPRYGSLLDSGCIFRMFPNYGYAHPPTLRSGHFDLKDVQCAENKDEHNIACNFISRLGTMGV